MKTMIRLFKAQDGATAIEYALIAALLVGIIVGAGQYLTTSISSSFSTVGSKISSAAK